jgi:hypothetical protein
LFASEEVLVELKRKADEVYNWALDREAMFIPTDEDIQRPVSNILSCHERLVDTRRNRSGADPFVIALAEVKGYTVVTYETRVGNPNKPYIPDVCDGLGIRSMSFLEFIREQVWVI